MNRLLFIPVAVALTALGACGGGSSPPGDVVIYWQFSHRLADGTDALYDASPAGTGQTWCPESGVDYVTIRDAAGYDVDPGMPTFNCVNELGDQGVIVRTLGPGTHTWTITGYRTVSNQDVPIYQTPFTFNVASGRSSDVLVTVPGIRDDLDLGAQLSTAGTPPQPLSCAAIGATTVTYSIVDWAGGEVRYGTFDCAGASPGVLLGGVERDNYAVRMQALSATGAVLADTLIPVAQGCGADRDPLVDHYGPTQVAIPVYDIRSFAAPCP